MSKPSLVMKYKGWEILTDGPVSYQAYKYVTCGKGKNKTTEVGGHRSGFASYTLAKRWIGRHEALLAGKGKRKPKAKPLKTKGIRIKHTCIKPDNRTFARFRFSKVRDSITYINRTYNNCGKSAFDDIILDCSDKTGDWFDGLPETYTCKSCKFSVTKAEIMNTYLFRKMGDKK